MHDFYMKHLAEDKRIEEEERVRMRFINFTFLLFLATIVFISASMFFLIIVGY